MKCADCEYLLIRQMPLRSGGIVWDGGLAECRKHNLVVEFANIGKFKRMECVETEEHRDDEEL